MPKINWFTIYILFFHEVDLLGTQWSGVGNPPLWKSAGSLPYQ